MVAILIQATIESEEMDDSILFSRHNRTDPHMKTERLWQHAQDLQILNPDSVSELRRGRRNKFLPLTKKLFATDTNKERENQLYPMVYHWVYYRAALCPRVAG